MKSVSYRTCLLFCFRKSNEDATAIFDLRVRDIGVMESHLKVTEELLAKTKNKITEVNSIKTWLCKERDRPGVNPKKIHFTFKLRKYDYSVTSLTV